MSLLSVRDLKVSYATSSEIQAVRGVSFDMEAGTILGLAGESEVRQIDDCQSCDAYFAAPWIHRWRRDGLRGSVHHKDDSE